MHKQLQGIVSELNNRSIHGFYCIAQADNENGFKIVASACTHCELSNYNYRQTGICFALFCDCSALQKNRKINYQQFKVLSKTKTYQPALCRWGKKVPNAIFFKILCRIRSRSACINSFHLRIMLVMYY